MVSHDSLICMPDGREIPFSSMNTAEKKTILESISRSLMKEIETIWFLFPEERPALAECLLKAGSLLEGWKDGILLWKEELNGSGEICHTDYQDGKPVGSLLINPENYREKYKKALSGEPEKA